MCLVCIFVFISTTLLYPRTSKTSPITLDLRMKPWTLICLTTCILLTRIMAASERGCCVPGCGKTRQDDTILHSFPNPDKDMDRYLEWTRAVGSNVSSLDPQYVYKHRRVCHSHFDTKYLTWTRRLSPNAIPTIRIAEIQMARVPLTDISNRSHTAPLDDALPSTSRGSAMALDPPVDMSNRNENAIIDAELPSTSGGKLLHQLRRKTPMSDQKALIKAVNKLQIKKDSYARRLKKALNLSENKTFQNTLKKFTALAALFTIMQFRESGKNKMGRRFTEPEKIMALSLYKRSPRTYRWLQKIFVLPSAMTLNRLIGRANLKPGYNENIFAQLKKRVDKMKADEKLCILLFDEMAIAPHFDYNQRKDIISGTNSAELARQIKYIIRKLHAVGLHVLATVCDQGASNVSAINLLIQDTKSIYVRENKELRRDIFEVDGKEVIPIYDPPHLIKGIRNNLITKNLKCSINGCTKIAKWEHIVNLYQEDPAYKGIRLVKKLSEQHINPDKFQKMKVKYATQVLSQKVAVTMGFLAERNILPAECMQTADVILFFDELFDSVNGSYDNSKKRSGKNLLTAVTTKSDHRAIWSKAKTVLSTMKFINKDEKTQGKQTTVPTINNWLRTINNVEYLIEKLSSEFSIKSVYMRHFNQDPLENFFGLIRSHGCRNTNPTAAGFESSFAALLINNLSGQHSPGSNCEDDGCQTIFKSMECLFANTENPSLPTDEIDFNFEGDYVNFEEKKQNPRILAALQYVTGYLLKKTRINIFKNCKKCKECYYDENNVSDFLKIREYKKGKTYLTYPKTELVILFSKIQDLVTYVLKKKPLSNNIKTYLKTLLYSQLDFELFDCDKHKMQTIEFMLELSCKFFICNWCRDVNKIINGTRIDLDHDDVIKMFAYNYYNKRKHCKK